MPRIAEFNGIIIAMYYNDHEPAHFHASYGEHRALISITTPMVIDGALPPRTLHMVLEWAAAIRQLVLLTLATNLFLPWGLAVEGGALEVICGSTSLPGRRTASGTEYTGSAQLCVTS